MTTNMDFARGHSLGGNSRGENSPGGNLKGWKFSGWKFTRWEWTRRELNETSSTIFLQHTDKEEIANIISFLNSNKASGPISIPYRLLFFLKNDIAKQLADLFNLSFTTGVFPSVLKTAKVVPVFKTDSKLDYSNYRPISLLSNI